MRPRLHRLVSGYRRRRWVAHGSLLGCLLLGAASLAPHAYGAEPRPAAAGMASDPASGPASDEQFHLLSAISERDGAALDRLASSGPAAVRALATVARVHGLDGAAARTAAIDAGFVVNWQILEPIPGGPRALDQLSAPLDDWIAGTAADTYSGVLGPTGWRPAGPGSRFGLLDLGVLTATVPGHRLARAAVRVADGGAAVAWVHSAGPWRLWIDGEPVGGGWGEASLRTAEPVLLNLGPGAHRLFVITDSPKAAVAIRFTALDGAPLPVEPLDGRARPDGVSLGPLPGKPLRIPDPLAGHAPETLPAELAPRAGISAATPAERRALAELAPDRADLWRRIAEESAGIAAADAWRRVAALDPLDLDARRRTDPHVWPPSPRTSTAARAAPPADATGPLWWAFARHRIEVGRGGTLLEGHELAVRALTAGAIPPWPPRDADAAACTVLRGPWVHPVACPRDGVPDPVIEAGDVAVITWRRGRRDAAATVAPPPAPFGSWSVEVEAAVDAPLRINAADAAVERKGDRRIWRVRAETAGGGPVMVSTVIDDGALATVLDRQLPPQRLVRLPAPDALETALAEALRRSAAQVDPLEAARVALGALAGEGFVADPVFARPIGAPTSALPRPADWPIPLLALGDRVIDPRFAHGARGADLQGAPAFRIGPDGRGRRIRLPLDPPEAHALTITGELRVDGSSLLAVSLSRRGHSPFPSPLTGPLPDGVEVLEETPDRLTLRQPTPAPLFALPGWSNGRSAGPQRVVIDLTIRAPAGSRAPADVAVDGPAGRYSRTTTPTADGWRTVRVFEWRAQGAEPSAFLDAVRAAEAEPLVLRGTP